MPNRGRDDFSLEQVAFVQALHRVHQVRQVQVRVARPHLGPWGGVLVVVWWCGGVVVW